LKATSVHDKREIFKGFSALKGIPKSKSNFVIVHVVSPLDPTCGAHCGGDLARTDTSFTLGPLGPEFFFFLTPYRISSAPLKADPEYGSDN
jgi:hypothetical protein